MGTDKDLSDGASLSDMDPLVHFIRAFFSGKEIPEKDVVMWLDRDDGFLHIQVVGIPETPVFDLEMAAIDEWGTDHVADSLEAMWEDYIAERGE